MARKGKTAVLKRARERDKAERAEHKRAQRRARQEAPAGTGGDRVASANDLAAFGLGDLRRDVDTVDDRADD